MSPGMPSAVFDLETGKGEILDKLGVGWGVENGICPPYFPSDSLERIHCVGCSMPTWGLALLGVKESSQRKEPPPYLSDEQPRRFHMLSKRKAGK